MKIISKIYLFFLFVFFSINEVLAQPGPPGGGGGPPCWPPSTCETPINNDLIFLLIAAIAFACVSKHQMSPAYSVGEKKGARKVRAKFGGSSGVNYLDAFTHMSFHNIPAGWSNYTDTWQPTSASDGPTTPWLYSEVRGNDVVKLFRLITIADGDTANNFLKFSYVSKDNSYDFLRDFC